MRRLLIRSGALGDCLVAFPVMEFLRADYTEVWLPSALVPLVQFADRAVSLYSTGIDRVGIGEPIEEALRDRISRFDHIVSWYGSNRPEFCNALANIVPNCTFLRSLPPADCSLHATDFLAAQVGAPGGLHPRLELGRVPTRKTIVIHPFSGSSRKNWPMDSYRALAKSLPYPVEWNAGPDEMLEDATRFDNLLELAQWIVGARAYIGNDSGVTHLAAATGVPTLALFGPHSSDVWRPRGQRVMVLRMTDMTSLSIDQVIRAL